MSEGCFYVLVFAEDGLEMRKLPTKTPSIEYIEKLVGGPYKAVKAFNSVMVTKKGAGVFDPAYLFRGSGVPGDNLYGFTKKQILAAIKKQKGEKRK